jgi:hypothetical protein
MVENLIDGQVLIWDGTNLRAVGSGEFVKKTDTATGTVAGVVKVNSSYGLSMTSGGIRVYKASNMEIDERTNQYRPIVPANLKYAVESVVGGHVVMTQTEYDAWKEYNALDENTFYYIKEEE